MVDVRRHSWLCDLGRENQPLWAAMSKSVKWKWEHRSPPGAGRMIQGRGPSVFPETLLRQLWPLRTHQHPPLYPRNLSSRRSAGFSLGAHIPSPAVPSLCLSPTLHRSSLKVSFLTAPSPPLNPLPSAFHLTTKEIKELGMAAPVPSLSPHCPGPLTGLLQCFPCWLSECSVCLLLLGCSASAPFLPLLPSHPHLSGWGAPSLFLPSTFLPG